MMKRRSLLMGAGALALSQMVSGCAGRGRAALRVRLLENSVPAQLLRIFDRSLDRQTVLNFVPVPQLADLFTQLQEWKQAQESAESSSGPLFWPFRNRPQRSGADLVTLGDYWLTAAIQQNLIQPLALDTLSEWPNLPDRWKTLIRRDRQGRLNPEGDLWAAPYRWGSTVIAYNVEAMDRLGWAPTDWNDLWRPEVQGRISLLDSPREVIGLTLKRLGRSFNTENPGQLSRLRTELEALHQQTKFYSSDNYLQPLILEDTWLAVGWSTDVLPVMERDRRIAAIVPASGTALTADLWVQPIAPSTEESSTKSELAQAWINFCWQRDTAIQLSLLSSAASPVLIAIDRETLPDALQGNNLLLPDVKVLERSEFLEPLPNDAIAQYRTLWTELRQAKNDFGSAG